MSTPIVPGASEFGGHPGVVQPEPHELTPSEQLNFAVQTDPSDATASALTVAQEHRRRGRARLNG